MPRTPHSLMPTGRRWIRASCRVAATVAALAVAGPMITGAGAAAAATVPSGAPVGNVDDVEAATGGLRVRGWAADADTTDPLTVRIAVAGTTRVVTTDVSRPDVRTVYPQFGASTGFDTVVPLPVGSHQVCVTVVNVGAGTDKAFGCRTATVTVGTAPAPAPVTAPVPVSPPPATTPGTLTPAPSRTLTWAPPVLTAPLTVQISAANRQPRLQAGKDYIIKMPATPLEAKGGLVLTGGRNIVLIGGEIKISQASTSANDLRGLYLKAQTGTVHIEGLKITGGALADGINLDERDGATVQLQNVRVDTVHGSHTGLHADVLQTWGGPKVLRVDGLTGYSTYQGFFLMPTQYGSAAPELFDLRNINIVGQTGSKYLLWRDQATWPVKTQNVWASTSQLNAPRSQFLMGSWPGVLEGRPASGDLVPAAMAGLGYVSPGYTR